MATSTPHPIFDPSTFANQIHALSLLDFHTDIQTHRINHAANAHGPASTIHQQLSLLDGLALLLITRPSEVVATSMRLTPERFILYWARNDNQALQAERQYLNLLRKHAVGTAPAMDILPDVVDYTKRKIVSRCQKLARHYGLNQENQKLGVENLMNVDTRTVGYQRLEGQLKRRSVIKPERRLVDYLDALLRGIARVDTQAKTLNLVGIIGQAFELCTKEYKLEGLVVREQSDRFRKLADYLDVISRFRMEMARLRSKGIREIRFEQIFAQQQPHRELISGPFLHALNKHAAHQPGFPQITSFENQIQTHYPHAQESTLVDQCQHAELTLALFLINTSQSSGGTYAIGLSKASCYWCCMYLDVANTALRSMAARKTEIVVRAATDGKRIDGWLLPKEERFAGLFLRWFEAEYRGVYEIVLMGGRRGEIEGLAEREGGCGEDVCGGEEPDFD